MGTLGRHPDAEKHFPLLVELVETMPSESVGELFSAVAAIWPTVNVEEGARWLLGTKVKPFAEYQTTITSDAHPISQYEHACLTFLGNLDGVIIGGLVGIEGDFVRMQTDILASLKSDGSIALGKLQLDQNRMTLEGVVEKFTPTNRIIAEEGEPNWVEPVMDGSFDFPE